MRDLLSWANFMNTVSGALTQPASYYHGARLMFIDSLMSESGDLRQLSRDRETCVQYLQGQLVAKELYDSVDLDVSSNEVELTCDQKFGIKSFYISTGAHVYCRHISIVFLSFMSEFLELDFVFVE